MGNASLASTGPGSDTFRIGKSLEKSTVVVPRMKAATPSTPAEPNSLSGDDSALESWKSSSRLSASFTAQATLKPSELFSFFVPRLMPPMERSDPVMFSE